MPLSRSTSALAARTAAQWRAENPCPTCGDDYRECAYCSSPATVESAVGLDGSYSEPNELGQRAWIKPRPEPRCEDCQADFERAAARQRRIDDYEDHCERLGDEMREGGV